MPFLHPALPVGVDAIRVLGLEPGDFTSPIVGTLTSVPFGDKPKYVALSYTWGDSYPDNSLLPTSARDSTTPVPSSGTSLNQPGSASSTSTEQSALEQLSDAALTLPATMNSPDKIMLNGQPFYIKHNLHLALLYLRSSTHSLFIWADAICIDQENIEERNYQVSIMSFIYTRAAKVVAWLGTPDLEHADYSFDSMAHNWKGGRTRHFAASLIEKLEMPVSPMPHLSAFSRMLESAYWKRLWIVQEICLPRLLVFAYGSYIWTYDQFKDFHASAASPGERLPRSNAHRLLETRAQRHTDVLKLESLIERFGKSECSEVRDRVYGLLGCANDIRPITTQGGADRTQAHVKLFSSGLMPASLPRRGTGSLEVDYLCSFYDIWTDLINFAYFQATILGRNADLQTKVLVDITCSDLEDLPDSQERSLSIVRTAGIVQAALDQRVEEELTSNKNILVHPVITAIGYIAGEILHLGPDYESLVGSSSAAQDWTSCWIHHYKKEGHLQTLRRTNEEYMAKILDYEPTDLHRIQHIYDSHVEIHRYGQKPYLGQKKLQNNQNIGDETRRICLGTGFIMGLVPPAAALHDVIVRFWNCDAAIIIRPLNRNMPLGGFGLVGRADIAEIIWPKPDLTAKSLWNIMSLPGSNADSIKSGSVTVKLGLGTLQKITAHIGTENERSGLLSF